MVVHGGAIRFAIALNNESFSNTSFAEASLQLTSVAFRKEQVLEVLKKIL